MQYLGIIEQRTSEILQAYAASQQMTQAVESQVKKRSTVPHSLLEPSCCSMPQVISSRPPCSYDVTSSVETFLSRKRRSRLWELMFEDALKRGALHLRLCHIAWIPHSTSQEFGSIDLSAEGRRQSEMVAGPSPPTKEPAVYKHPTYVRSFPSLPKHLTHQIQIITLVRHPPTRAPAHIQQQFTSLTEGGAADSTVPLRLNVQPPAWDDFSSGEDSDQEDDERPLTREELKRKTLRGGGAGGGTSGGGAGGGGPACTYAGGARGGGGGGGGAAGNKSKDGKVKREIRESCIDAFRAW